MTDFMDIAEQWMREHKPEQEEMCFDQQAGTSAADPGEWVLDFLKWKTAQTVHREGYCDAGSVKFLHADFCDWCIASGEVPATREVFEQLLRADGWEISQYEMVEGLVLRVDLAAWQESERHGRRANEGKK